MERESCLTTFGGDLSSSKHSSELDEGLVLPSIFPPSLPLSLEQLPLKSSLSVCMYNVCRGGRSFVGLKILGPTDAAKNWREREAVFSKKKAHPYSKILAQKFFFFFFWLFKRMEYYFFFITTTILLTKPS